MTSICLRDSLCYVSSMLEVTTTLGRMSQGLYPRQLTLDYFFVSVCLSTAWAKSTRQSYVNPDYECHHFTPTPFIPAYSSHLASLLHVNHALLLCTRIAMQGRGQRPAKRCTIFSRGGNGHPRPPLHGARLCLDSGTASHQATFFALRTNPPCTGPALLAILRAC